MREVDEEIREIKKEIIESRGLVIKTNNLTSSLGADIKAIAKRQAAHERRTWWNSVVAYGMLGAWGRAVRPVDPDAVRMPPADYEAGVELL